MTAAALEALLIAAHLRGEALLYIPTVARRERAPAVTFVTVRGDK